MRLTWSEGIVDMKNPETTGALNAAVSGLPRGYGAKRCGLPGAKGAGIGTIRRFVTRGPMWGE